MMVLLRWMVSMATPEVAKHLNSGPVVCGRLESNVVLSITDLGRRCTWTAQARPDPLDLGWYGLLGPLRARHF
jgi:hypothetical protein